MDNPIEVSSDEKLEFMNVLITEMDNMELEPQETFCRRNDDRLIATYNKYIKPLHRKIKAQQETIDELTKFISNYEVEKRK